MTTPLLTNDHLQHLVRERWLNSQRHPTLPLTIYNYTPQAQFAKHWTPETLACRGLILDDDDHIVARPLPKFFNLDELPSLPNGPFEVFDKADGSLFIVARSHGEIVTATRGSFTSPQADLGRALLARQGTDWVEPGLTYCFELIHPANRIVVDYGQRSDLELLAVINSGDGHEFDIFNRRIPFLPVGYYGWKTDPQQLAFRVGAEGYVLRFTDSTRVKVKFAEYVRLHRLLTGINAVHIWEAMARGDDMTALLDAVPDEFYEWVRLTEGELRARFLGTHDVLMDCFSRIVADVGTDNRRVFAERAMKTPNPPVMFALLDKKDPAPLIWKMLKPERSQPFRCGDVTP